MYLMWLVDRFVSRHVGLLDIVCAFLISLGQVSGYLRQSACCNLLFCSLADLAQNYFQVATLKPEQYFTFAAWLLCFLFLFLHGF